MDLNRASGTNDEIRQAVDDLFIYHPWDEEKSKMGYNVRKALSDAVKVIIMSVPPCPDRTTAIRKIREARMDCNSAITFDGKY